MIESVTSNKKFLMYVTNILIASTAKVPLSGESGSGEV